MSQPEYEPANPTSAPTGAPTDPVTSPVIHADAGAQRLPVRMRTVVIGIVLLAVAVLCNLKVTTALDFQLGTVVLALMIGCGILLIAGASRRE